MLDGYLLLIARREDPEDPTIAISDRGPLVVYQDLLDRAVGLLNGSEGRLAITEEERERAYRVISRYYDKIGQDAPALSPVYLDFEAQKKNSEITNFPKRGDDLKVSLRNSQWDLFDPSYAAKLKEEYPKIWRAGGNIRGNDQYRRLTPIVKNNGVATSESEENAIRLREAWIARHEGDGAQFRDRDHPINLSTVAGLVALIKWYGVSVIGESRMKQVLNELKRKLDKEDRSFQPDQRSQMWLDWIEKSQKQAEDGIRRRVNGYFRGARRRFVRLVEENTQQGLLDVVRAQKEEELRLLKQGYQGEFVKWFMLTGSSELDRVFRIADVARPLDLVFGRRDLAVQLSDRAAQQMTDTTINSVESIIQRGLVAGASVPQIASNLSNSLAFSQDRSLRIARTESTKAVNAATDQAYRQAATAGIDIQKQWLSSRDAKVREAHAELDGVVVGVNEEFESEGYTSPSPANFGDPSLDVNCRCTIVPVIDGKTDL